MSDSDQSDPDWSDFDIEEDRLVIGEPSYRPRLQHGDRDSDHDPADSLTLKDLTRLEQLKQQEKAHEHLLLKPGKVPKKAKRKQRIRGDRAKRVREFHSSIESVDKNQPTIRQAALEGLEPPSGPPIPDLKVPSSYEHLADTSSSRELHVQSLIETKANENQSLANVVIILSNENASLGVKNNSLVREVKSLRTQVQELKGKFETQENALKRHREFLLLIQQQGGQSSDVTLDEIPAGDTFESHAHDSIPPMSPFIIPSLPQTSVLKPRKKRKADNRSTTTKKRTKTSNRRIPDIHSAGNLGAAPGISAAPVPVISGIRLPGTSTQPDSICPPISTPCATDSSSTPGASSSGPPFYATGNFSQKPYISATHLPGAGTPARSPILPVSTSSALYSTSTETSPSGRAIHSAGNFGIEQGISPTQVPGPSATQPVSLCSPEPPVSATSANGYALGVLRSALAEQAKNSPLTKIAFNHDLTKKSPFASRVLQVPFPVLISPNGRSPASQVQSRSFGAPVTADCATCSSPTGSNVAGSPVISSTAQRADVRPPSRNQGVHTLTLEPSTSHAATAHVSSAPVSAGVDSSLLDSVKKTLLASARLDAVINAVASGATNTMPAAEPPTDVGAPRLSLWPCETSFPAFEVRFLTLDTQEPTVTLMSNLDAVINDVASGAIFTNDDLFSTNVTSNAFSNGRLQKSKESRIDSSIMSTIRNNAFQSSRNGTSNVKHTTRCEPKMQERQRVRKILRTQVEKIAPETLHAEDMRRALTKQITQAMLRSPRTQAQDAESVLVTPSPEAQRTQNTQRAPDVGCASVTQRTQDTGRAPDVGRGWLTQLAEETQRTNVKCTQTQMPQLTLMAQRANVTQPETLPAEETRRALTKQITQAMLRSPPVTSLDAISDAEAYSEFDFLDFGIEQVLDGL